MWITRTQTERFDSVATMNKWLRDTPYKVKDIKTTSPAHYLVIYEKQFQDGEYNDAPKKKEIKIEPVRIKSIW